jgi:cytosine/adenosine deaminase-related metal-dependent hydrolase
MNDIVLLGRVLTVDPERRVHARGAVYIHDGMIEAVQTESAAAPAGFGAALRVRTGGMITPGLIDLHNHLAYNTLPLWIGRDDPYKTRYQWPGAPTYQSDVSNPAQALGIAAPAAALRFAEVKAVVGGVTAIQGSPPVTRAFPGWMVRNVEKEQIGSKKPIFQSVLPATKDQLDTTAGRMTQGRSFIYHLSEGVDPSLRAEFTLLSDHGCVGDGLIGIHSTALTAADFSAWKTKGGGAIVWSPLSNLWLYGGTTDVLAARAAGVRVCLGSDWTPSGTRNVLGELKIAATWNEHSLSGALSDADIVEMVTANPGDTLARAWGVPVGRLVPGALADVSVFADDGSDPWGTVLASTERNVRLVMVGGRPAYGNIALLRAAGAEAVEPITVTGIRRGIVMQLPDELQPAEPDLQAEASKSWAAGLAELGAVWADPAGAVRKARRRRAAGAPVFEFVPDMPSAKDDDSRALDEDELDQLVMPTFDGIGHDATWCKSVIRRAPAHAEILRTAMARF